MVLNASARNSHSKTIFYKKKTINKSNLRVSSVALRKIETHITVKKDCETGEMQRQFLGDPVFRRTMHC